MRWNNIVFFALITVAGCTAGNSLAEQSDKQVTARPQFTAGPPTLVYKTRKEYSNNVPVLLSDDKTSIVSYPDPKDLKTGETYPLPTALENGYLLDNRGIGINVAYLGMTYPEYAALSKAPSRDSLMQMIVDKDPLTELYNCGNRQAYKDVVNDLNALIRAGQLKQVCKVVK